MNLDSLATPFKNAPHLYSELRKGKIVSELTPEEVKRAYSRVRRRTVDLCAPLSTEALLISSTDETSPAKMAPRSHHLGFLIFLFSIRLGRALGMFTIIFSILITSRSAHFCRKRIVSYYRILRPTKYLLIADKSMRKFYFGLNRVRRRLRI